jgi:hypothetical protein
MENTSNIYNRQTLDFFHLKKGSSALFLVEMNEMYRRLSYELCRWAFYRPTFLSTPDSLSVSYLKLFNMLIVVLKAMHIWNAFSMT